MPGMCVCVGHYLVNIGYTFSIKQHDAASFAIREIVASSWPAGGTTRIHSARLASAAAALPAGGADGIAHDVACSNQHVRRDAARATWAARRPAAAIAARDGATWGDRPSDRPG
jgi:hypothetical protein